MQVARRKGSVSGLLLVLLGAWAALIPFVGPYFNYGFGANETWVWHTSRLWMNVLPGAAAVLAGLVLLGLAERFTLAFGAWLASAAGAWLVIAPVVSVFWNHNASLTGSPLGGAHRQAFEYLGFYYGVGAAILFLGAIALGRLSVVGVRDVQPVVATTVAEERRPIGRDDIPASERPVTAGTDSPRRRLRLHARPRRDRRA